MSAAPEDLHRTLEDAGRQITNELREAEQQKLGLESTAPDRERIVNESLENARTYYKRKHYARAFAEWERACSVIGDAGGFRRKVRELKESHDNLVKVNRELAETREALSQRAIPNEHKKFVQDSHEAASGEVKKVYSHLSQQLQTDRSAADRNSWLPLFIALGVVAAGFVVLAIYHTAANKRMTALQVQAAAVAPAASPVDSAFQQAQSRKALEQETASLKEMHRQEMEELRSQHAQASQGDREKIVQLETRLKEEEAKNSDLQRRIGLLVEENSAKQDTFNALN